MARKIPDETPLALSRSPSLSKNTGADTHTRTGKGVPRGNVSPRLQKKEKLMWMVTSGSMTFRTRLGKNDATAKALAACLLFGDVQLWREVEIK